MNTHDTTDPGRVAQALTINGRRNLRLLTETLRTLTPGTFVEATFRSDLYGTHLITGAVARSSATDGLLLGGQPLDTNGVTRNPARELVTLTERNTLPVHHSMPRDDVHLEKSVAALHHGAIVEAVFERSPYGRFAITGFVIHAPAGDVFAIGDGHFLTRRGRRGAADRLIALRLLADADSHGLPVPQPVLRWPDSTPIDS